ncbi:hypothetical protein CQA42_07575 [Helicobacter sp. MIT 99-5507]|nr:hypothetical protein CQA42_07575 [Helicobacter sp. MIT 99-5507]
MSKIFVEKLPVVETHKIDSTFLKEIESLANEILESNNSCSCHSEACLQAEESNHIKSKRDISGKSPQYNKKSQHKSNTKALESRLDSLIYQAYGLNEKEINLIESELSTRERERERTEIIENLYRLYTQFYDFTYNFTMESQVAYQGKILYPCIMANKSCFVYEEKGFFAPAPANLITGKECDMKYLTGFLNSSFVYFLMREFYMGGGIEGELKTNNLLKLPIPKTTKANQTIVNQIIALVDEILKLKAKDSTTDTSKLESEIDSLVYKLYNLTESEIKIIEGK